MKILAISDVESKYLWDYFQPEKLEGVDLILSCGDLKASYLTLLATFTHAPLLYVHGNHDASYDREPPRGAICIDDDLYWYKGYRIVGLGGSCRYRAGAWQFTEAEMKRRAGRLSAVQAGAVSIYTEGNGTPCCTAVLQNTPYGRGRYHRCPCACPRLQRRRRPRTYGF